ncbi:MAG: hypothetical protein JO352_20275 [Chloroflexi bacterium]|nr:hypothetical protein [Chloroflexota bacterium]MBV9597478.1 hypothetical protein [Chloroflexota bacterium]
MNDSEALGAVDILVLEALALAGGNADRDQLLSAVQPMLWGHMADSAGRRAGYTGQDEQQLHTSGQKARSRTWPSTLSSTEATNVAPIRSADRTDKISSLLPHSIDKSDDNRLMPAATF